MTDREGASVRIFYTGKDSSTDLLVGLLVGGFALRCLWHLLLGGFPPHNVKAVWFGIILCSWFSASFLGSTLYRLATKASPVFIIEPRAVSFRNLDSRRVDKLWNDDIEDIFLYSYWTRRGRQYGICLKTKWSEVRRVHATHLTEKPERVLELIRESVWGRDPDSGEVLDLNPPTRRGTLRAINARSWFWSLLLSSIFIIGAWISAYP